MPNQNQATPAMPNKPTVVAPLIHENMARGVLFSLGAIIVGIICWLILWRIGVIASLVSFLIAFLAVKLYTLGAGTMTRKGVPAVIAVITVGIVLSFLAGMASDAFDFYAKEVGNDDLSILFSGDFWSFFGANLFSNGELWGSYVTDIIFAVVFGVLGTFGIIKDLIVPRPQEPQAK